MKCCKVCYPGCCPGCVLEVWLHQTSTLKIKTDPFHLHRFSMPVSLFFFAFFFCCSLWLTKEILSGIIVQWEWELKGLNLSTDFAINHLHSLNHIRSCLKFQLPYLQSRRENTTGINNINAPYNVAFLWLLVMSTDNSCLVVF